jgi:hypothetical protein
MTSLCLRCLRHQQTYNVQHCSQIRTPLNTRPDEEDIVNLLYYRKWCSCARDESVIGRCPWDRRLPDLNLSVICLSVVVRLLILCRIGVA